MAADNPSILGRYVSTDASETVTVELLNFPLQVFAVARQHHDELLREFALLALSPPQDRPGHAVPKRLLDLIETLGVRYAGVGDRTDAARDDAVARGDAAMDLTYVAPASVGPAMKELHDLMQEADEFCRDGQMLTLAATPLERSFREWFTSEFTQQADGRPPTPWTGGMVPDSD
jgi:hypothetical protein